MLYCIYNLACSPYVCLYVSPHRVIYIYIFIYIDLINLLIYPIQLATVTGALVLACLFRRDLSGSCTVPDLKPADQLLDPRGAIFHALVLGR